MVTNVTSLLKTVKAVEDEATKGTRALEATIEHIKQELTVGHSFFKLKCLCFQYMLKNYSLMLLPVHPPKIRLYLGFWDSKNSFVELKTISHKEYPVNLPHRCLAVQIHQQQQPHQRSSFAWPKESQWQLQRQWRLETPVVRRTSLPQPTSAEGLLLTCCTPAR